MTGYVAYVDVVAARLNGDAIIATLVEEVRKLDVAGIHCVCMVRSECLDRHVNVWI